MRESGAIVDLSKDGGPLFLVPFRSSFFWNKALEHRPRHYYYPGSAPAVRPTKMIAIDHDLPGSRDDSDFDGKKVRCSPQSFCSNSFQDPRGETGGTLARDKMTREIAHPAITISSRICMPVLFPIFRRKRSWPLTRPLQPVTKGLTPGHTEGQKTLVTIKADSGNLSLRLNLAILLGLLTESRSFRSFSAPEERF